MRRSQTGRAIGFLFAALPMLLQLPSLAHAQVDDRPAAHGSHTLQIDAKPTVRKLASRLTLPRRVEAAPDGTALVVDSTLGTLTRFTTEGTATVIAADILEPTGVAAYGRDEILVTEFASGMLGAGALLLINAEGELFVHAAGLPGPVDVTVAPDGTPFVACLDGTVARIGPDGSWTTIASGLPQPSAITVDPVGRLLIASTIDGSIRQISTSGELELLREGLRDPVDLAVDSEGHLIVACEVGNELLYIDGSGGKRTFAHVPTGTSSIAFDKHDNIYLVNTERHTLLRVVINVFVDCPHCGDRLKLQFRRPGGLAKPKPASEPDPGTIADAIAEGPVT
ncbi:Vgb family protein [Stratiformator vulcanicus]|uniref:Virginiamycin B lyase n=1 Tax=Stratiformator vulcanicus TaxID=2527980 RepID=A0A517QZK1_9PLAN|nr:hypothetical protein [Stratiformator vulcanicus]QDT37061.1 Virginiamycin B lyase [Stratiformator vulcanicus]